MTTMTTATDAQWAVERIDGDSVRVAYDGDAEARRVLIIAGPRAEDLVHRIEIMPPGTVVDVPATSGATTVEVSWRCNGHRRQRWTTHVV